jgi:hypothetical protein
MGKQIKACRILVEKPDGNKPLGRPRCRWEDNIEMGFKCDGVIWTGLIWLRIGSRLLSMW